ncbi:hypothetical protein LCGC14_1604910 [marine sediment metagenome]|uniref:YdbS-like PH domain-containing protein n=1 Tax=marine sediment metagenome TaxID=412755 RepID=A0A0F9IAC4_9ZZZZ
MEWLTPEDVIRPHLDAREELLWSGRPVQGIRLRGQDVFLIPFSLLWGGFAIFWEAMALGMFFAAAAADGNGAPSVVRIIFPLFGLPFVLIGLYLIIGRFFVDAKRRARTFWGVTKDRIIIVSGLFSQKVTSLNLSTVSDLSMTQKRDGSGSITFGPTHPMAAMLRGTSWPGMGTSASSSFDLVPDVAEPYRIIRDAQGQK